MKFTFLVCFPVLVSGQGAPQFSIDDALRSARSSRPAFEAARLQLDQTRQKSRALRAGQPTRLSLGYTGDQETGGSDEDLVVSQPIDLFGRTDARRRLASALTAKAEATYRESALRVQTEVLDAYLDAAGAAELAQSAAASQVVVEKLYEATRLRVEGGVAPGFHLTRVALEVEESRLRAAQLQGEAESAARKLAFTVGLSAPQRVDRIPELPELGAGPEIRKQRADLLLLAADVDLAEAEYGLAVAEGRPELEVQGRRTPWQERDARFAVRVQLSLPLFDHGRIKGETRAAAAQREAAKKALEDASLLAEGEVQAARTQLNALADQVRKYDDLVARAKQLVDRLQPGLTEQATTLLEVLDVTRALRELEEARVEARIRWSRAQARLIAAAGHLIEVHP